VKIVDVRTHLTFGVWRNFVFVEIETDEGLTGLGEATLEGKAQTIAAAVADLSRYLVGKDPRRIEEHAYAMYRNAFWRGGPVLNSAISGVEQALWDIKGQALGAPVYELLGGPCRERVKAYANGWFAGARTPEEYAERAAWATSQGFRALKWDPFGRSDLFIDRETANQAVECVQAVRAAVGPDVELLIEVHGRLSPANAIRLAHRLEPYDIGFYEEPVPPENIAAMEKVARAVNVPIATGERLFTVFGFRELLERQVADIIQPDPCHTGGISGLKKIAGMAEAYYVAVAPHNPNGPVATAVCLQLAACLPNFLFLETPLDLGAPWRKELLTEPLETFVDGYYELPTKPGLGIQLNMDVVKAHPYQPVDMRMFG
jgi:galactonate dehydratase